MGQRLYCHHAVIYGVDLAKYPLEFILLKENPDWRGLEDTENPHWIRSETSILDIKTERGKERASKMSGMVFPDGRIDRNLLESGHLKDPALAREGDLCYLDKRGYLGELLLHNSTNRRETLSPSADLRERLYHVYGVSTRIRELLPSLKPEDLQIIQAFFWRPFP